jgi:uncharacterized membrane protein YozB (DUF420 family)
MKKIKYYSIIAGLCAKRGKREKSESFILGAVKMTICFLLNFYLNLFFMNVDFSF